MAARPEYCRICGAAVVGAPAEVCQLHLGASEEQLLAEQANKPSAWVLAAEAAAVRPPTAKRELRPSPVLEEKPPTQVAGLELASVSQRFWAVVIDLFAATVIAGFLAALASASPTAALVVGLAGWWAYFLLANSLGQLAGKATMGIKVIDPATGREPGIVKGARRTIGQAFSLVFALFFGSLTFGFGFVVLVWLMITWNVRNVTIHDELAGTVVVRTTRARQ